MCIDPGSLIVLTSLAITAAVATGISSAVQTKEQNAAAQMQYNQQLEYQKRNNQAIQNQLDETVARQRLDANRQAVAAQQTAQEKIAENLRRQGAATASAASAGITGQPLQNLFNDYQVSIGNVSSNLQTEFQQINQNLFFNNRDAQLQAQSSFNQATPVAPLLQSSHALLNGATAGISTFASGFAGSIGSGVPNGAGAAKGARTLGDFTPYTGGIA